MRFLATKEETFPKFWSWTILKFLSSTILPRQQKLWKSGPKLLPNMMRNGFSSKNNNNKEKDKVIILPQP